MPLLSSLFSSDGRLPESNCCKFFYFYFLKTVSIVEFFVDESLDLGKQDESKFESEKFQINRNF